MCHPERRRAAPESKGGRREAKSRRRFDKLSVTRRYFHLGLARTVAASIALAGAVAFPMCGGADPPEHTTTLADQTSVNLTIYNGSLALVHDRRHVALAAGENPIAWRDVSANMDATTAILEDTSAPGAVRVVEQNFNYDLLRPQAILDKYVGRSVTVVHDKPIPGRPARETAMLLSDNEGIVLKYSDRVETQLEGHLEFPGIPPDLRDRPTLVLDLATDKAADADLDLSYISGGLAWHADYVGVVAPDESHMDLSGLVTLSNSGGTTFRDAHLQLVAGNVNVAQPPPTRMIMGAIARSVSAAPQFTQENYFEYHLYTLQRTTTIANEQTKQVSLLSAHDVPIHKTLELRGSPYYYSSRNGDLGTKLKVGVYETFTNKGGDLGIPLPGGTVRLYKNDTAGTSQFLGSDRIDHTPRNEDVRLHLGDSFDVTANRKQTDFKLPGNCTFQTSYEIEVKNAKTDLVDVLIVEPIPGDWSITSESQPHVKSSSSTATWTVHVPPGSSTKLDYTALVKVCL